MGLEKRSPPESHVGASEEHRAAGIDLVVHCLCCRRASANSVGNCRTAPRFTAGPVQAHVSLICNALNTTHKVHIAPFFSTTIRCADWPLS